jgi:hypothetical protein
MAEEEENDEDKTYIRGYRMITNISSMPEFISE